METSTKQNKIIWAFDPTQDPKDAKNIIKELRTWAKHLNCKVQPVAIQSKYLFKYPAEIDFPWKEEFKDVAIKNMDRYIEKAKVQDFLLPEVVFVNTFSNRKMAAEMAQYAEKTDAEMVFVSTRAKKTWNPFRLGGFAEALLTLSKVPVLLLNPNAQPSSKVSSVLFPTDFSAKSKNAFVRLTGWLKAFHSKVLLYNQIESPNIYYPPEIYEFSPGEAFLTLESIKDIKEMRLKKAQRWIQQMAKDNIQASTIIQKQKKTLAQEILETAEKNKCNLIAIESHTGPLARVLIGSVARDVLLQAKCPVLIFYRPKLMRIHTSKKKQVTNRKYQAKPATNQVATRHN